MPRKVAPTYVASGVTYTTSEMLQRMLRPTDHKRSRGGRISSVRCVDGFIFSVQASSGHYCTPRNDEGPWISAEVYFSHKSSPRPKRGWGRDRGVDGNIRLDKIAALIDAHGGLAYEVLA